MDHAPTMWRPSPTTPLIWSSRPSRPAGTADRRRSGEALAHHRFQGVTGTMTFHGPGDPDKSAVVLQIQEGHSPTSDSCCALRREAGRTAPGRTRDVRHDPEDPPTRSS